jgi:hypothetical protein
VTHKSEILRTFLGAAAAVLSFSAADTMVAQTKHPPTVHTPHPMSEETARQLLKIYGITKVDRLDRSGNTYLASGVVDGQRVELEIDSLTGGLRERGKTERLHAPNSMRQPPPTIERKEIVRPELMQGIDAAR